MSAGLNRFDTAIDRLISTRLYDTHTQMPCEVTAVNLNKEIPTVDVKVLWEGRSQENSSLNYKYPEILDVPVYMLAAGPDVRITVPIKVGTLGVVLFPEKPLYEFDWKTSSKVVMTSELTSFPLQGLLFLPSYQCGPVDANNIIIQNKSCIITITGESVNISAPSGMTVNGAQITPDGDVVTAAGVSLNNVKAVYNAHTHGGGPQAEPQL